MFNIILSLLGVSETNYNNPKYQCSSITICRVNLSFHTKYYLNVLAELLHENQILRQGWSVGNLLYRWFPEVNSID